MKKHIAAILSMILIFSLAGCKKEEPIPEIDMSVPQLKTHEGSVISFEYDERYLALDAEEEGEYFMYSLTKKGEDAYSVPRIDMFGIEFEGVGESADEAKEGFERFALSLFSLYFEASEDGPGISFSETEAQEGEGGIRHYYTKCLIEETESFPAFIMEVNGFGAAKGVCIITLYQADLDEESVKVLHAVIRSVRFSDVITIKSE